MHLAYSNTLLINSCVYFQLREEAVCYCTVFLFKFEETRLPCWEKCRQEIPPKHRYLSTKRHGATAQKSVNIVGRRRNWCCR